MSKKKELIIKILKELDENSKLLKQNDLGIENELEYAELLEIMTEGHLVSNIKVTKIGASGKFMIHDANAKITIMGIGYLENSSKENILEEIRDLLKDLNLKTPMKN